MALPWVLLAVGAAATIDYRAKRKRIQTQRYLPNQQLSPLGLAPSEWLPGTRSVAPKPGSIVVCHVYGVVEHSGIYLGDDIIVELHGSGLIRGISARRFLHGRTGATIFVACDNHHQPLQLEAAIDRAASMLFAYRNYHLRNNNCHRFVWWCLSGQERRLRSFDELNEKLSSRFGCSIFWDPATVSSFPSLRLATPTE